MLLVPLIVAPAVAQQRDRAREPQRPAAPDASVGPVRFAAPKGWQRVLEPDRDVRIYSAPTTVAGEDATLMISVGAVSDPADFNFRERFDEFVQLTLKGLEPRKRDGPASGKTKQGQATLTQRVTTENGAGKPVVAKIVAIDLHDRLAGFCLLANSDKTFAEFEREFDAVVASASVTMREKK